MKTVIIDGKEVKVGKLMAKRGWYLLHDLGRMAGPSLVEASEDRFASAISQIFRNTSKEEIYSLLEELGKEIIVDNKNLNLGDYSFTAKCIGELLMYNYEDFFSPLAEALKSMVNQEQET